jgi:two-component system, NtrC family, response regulator HydG
MTRGDEFDVDTQLSPKVARAEAGSPTFSLTVVDGADRGKAIFVAPGQALRVLAGQSPACDLRLTDRMVSRRHAAFELSGARLRVTDLESTNGTFVQGVGVLDAFLQGGEVVSLGSTAIRVDRVASAARAPLPLADRFGKLIGESPEMRALYPLCERLAASSVPSILEGETGTGKEVLAESLHEMGPRASGPFVVFDCTAVPPNLVESALFGHERGSFTGATEARRGVFEEAHGGTLLLDEIGDLDLPLQAKLLRAIERSEVQRVGGNRWIKVDVRVLSATRRDLDREIQAGRFRDDLFYRLAVTRIELPPLRKRAGDALVLARHFWARIAPRGAPFPVDFAQRIESYAWPGNVRELANSVARRVAIGEEAPIHSVRPPSDGAPTSARGGDAIEAVLAQDLPLPRARERVVEEFERRYVQRVLAAHNGNVSVAAAASGIARRYFQILRARHGGA